GLHPVWNPKPFSTSAKDIVLRAGSAGAVKGRVVGADGALRPNSQINIQDAAGNKVGTWGGSMNVKADGTFSFENVPVGKYVISPKPIFLPGVPMPAEAKTITVEAGKTVEVEFKVK
ncbi:MAG: carboxypeptidase-like regulatory domain-containing protein, partial [Planctomycetota bacterium]|nr:carboxypeptidase-like regulatory domain-containing protein [Planctomycetota bacterium]